MLSLMAWWLVEISKEYSNLNATVIGDHKYVYEQVNLGFTVQSALNLYLIVVEAANQLSARQFVNRLSELQVKAVGDSLKPDELAASTIAFTSMARWQVSRHIPVLPRHNSLIVAHSSPQKEEAVIGAAYDHRLLHGGDVARILQRLVQPPEKIDAT